MIDKATHQQQDHKGINEQLSFNQQLDHIHIKNHDISNFLR